MTKKALVPRKARTAYELLEQVCEVIKAHPLNYYQNAWKSHRSRDNCAPLRTELDTPENVCGTSYCRAGWIVTLVDGERHRRGDQFRWDRRARQILDMPAQRDEFGFEENDDLSNLFDGDYSGEVVPGSRAYVARGIAGIRRFMKKHKAHLVARSLRNV